MKFTGERVIPDQCEPDLLNEHLARYLFARQFTPGKKALDAACGAGYGTRMLAESAQAVHGVDIDPEAVDYARRHYATPEARFTVADCTSLPFPPDHFEVVIAFEILEHLADAQPLLRELDRVLAPGGILVLSTPNRLYYTDDRGERNPFHPREYDYAELNELLHPHFAHCSILFENHVTGLSIAGSSTNSGDSNGAGKPGVPTTSLGPAISSGDESFEDRARTAFFFIAVCSAQPLPELPPMLYVPSTGNVLREREQHIHQLQKQVSELEAHLERARKREQELTALLEEREQHIHQLQKQVSELEAHLERARKREQELTALLEERTRWARQLDGEMKSLGEKYQSLHAEFEDRTEWALRLDAELRHIHSTRWYRIGRKLRLSPDAPPEPVSGSGDPAE